MIIEYFQEFVRTQRGIKPGRTTTREIKDPRGAVFRISLDVPDFLFEPLVIEMKIEADYQAAMTEIMSQIVADVKIEE